MIEHNNFLQLCNSDFIVTNIVSYHIPSSAIRKETVRTKGQITRQRFFYITSGKFTLVTKGKKIVAQKNSLLYLPPDATYISHWESTEESSAIATYFDIILDNVKTTISNEIFIINSNDNIVYDFNTLAESYASQKAYGTIKTRYLFYKILYQIMKSLVNISDTEENIIYSTAIPYIEDHIMDEIDVNNLAKICSMSPSSFRAKFKKETNMSPIKYKNFLLMKTASELLLSTDLTVNEIACKLGVNDTYYFNKLFKQTYGVSPGMFRKKNHE